MVYNMAGELLGLLMYTFVQMFIGIVIILYGSVPSLYGRYDSLNSKKWLRIAIIVFGSVFFIFQVIRLFYI